MIGKWFEKFRARRVPAGPTLSVDDLHRRHRADGIRIIDVRTPGEFRGPFGHIDGAENVPLAEFTQHMSALAFHRDQPVALICRTDRRSAQAQSQLLQAGFRQPLLVLGGMEAWNRQGLPVVEKDKS